MFKDSGKPIAKRIFKRKEDETPPMICFTEQVLAKFKGYVDNCSLEIGWLALVKTDAQGRYIVYDTLLPHQNVSAVTTDLMESGLQEVGEEILSTRPDEFNNVRCWCHSHVNMQVCPSGTDDSTFEQFYENCEYFIRVICNKKGDMRVDFVDLEKEIRFDNINWYILLSKETEVLNNSIEKYQKEIDEIAEKNKKVIEELSKKIDEYRNNLFKELETNIKEEIKEKVKEEGPIYKKYGTAQYGNCYAYNMDDYYSDYYTNYPSYYNQKEEKKKEEIEEEEFELEWYKMSQKEKESVCELAMVQLLDKEDGTYYDALDVVSKSKFVKMLDAYTLNDLKDILKDESITKGYTEDNWIDLYDELEQFGIEMIESTLRGEMDYGL